MAARTSPRKIIVEFPPKPSRMDHMREEVSVNRSAFIRSAVEHDIRALERRKLEKELAEGYAAKTRNSMLRSLASSRTSTPSICNARQVHQGNDTRR